MKKIEIGTKVFAIDGPGQDAESPARTGTVVEILDEGRFGLGATIRWEDGSEEGFDLHSIRDPRFCGIGVYVAKGN